MALETSGVITSGKNALNLAGAGIELEYQHAITINHTFAGVDEEVVYTVPAGRKLYIGKFTMVNTDSSAHAFRIKINDILVYLAPADAVSTYYLNFESPAILTAGQTIKMDSDFANCEAVIQGWLI